MLFPSAYLFTVFDIIFQYELQAIYSLIPSEFQFSNLYEYA